MGVRTKHDESNSDLSPLRVRCSDHGGILDCGVEKQLGLDLGRINIDAPAYEHVLSAARYIEESVSVAASGITGVPPAMLIKRRGGGLGIVPVAITNVWTTKAEFADLADRDI